MRKLSNIDIELYCEQLKELNKEKEINKVFKDLEAANFSGDNPLIEKMAGLLILLILDLQRISINTKVTIGDIFVLSEVLENFSNSLILTLGDILTRKFFEKLEEEECSGL